MQLTDSIETLPGVGVQNAKKLGRLGIFNIRDLLHHFPWRYDDLSRLYPIAEVQPGGTYAIRARIVDAKLRPARNRRLSILETLVADDTGSLGIVWFNQSYLEKILQKNQEFLFAGPVTFWRTLQMQNPVWERPSPRPLHVGRIVPVYPLTAGVFPKWLRALLERALRQLPALPETLPPPIVRQAGLLPYDQAIRRIHFPASMQDARQARRRFGFEELFVHELGVLRHKRRESTLAAPAIAFDENLIRSFVARLPFQLTAGQKKAAWDVLQDMEKSHPANRVITGDVGSGKTVVAAMAALQAVRRGFSVAFMAPTEILARQHFDTLLGLPQLKAAAPLVLLTGSQALVCRDGAAAPVKKKDAQQLLRQQAPLIAVGTHALIQKNVAPKKLGLVIVDEQHRFGVAQRAALQAASPDGQPHFLSLTATPIPRTLSLTLFGDLDVSPIRQLPAGRRPIATRLVRRAEREEMYRFVDGLLSAGQQAFVICPLIDPSDTLGVKSATEEAALLQKDVFPGRRVGLLHGRLSAAQKNAVMEQFRQKQLDLLVATTVVEVGVDFPNATAMLIEGAERFGLAQLHQLRGRVGRSDLPSYCFLLPTSETPGALQRLQAVGASASGLELAETDLKLRGPGDTYGLLQSGFPEFKIADIFDVPTLTLAYELAKQFLERGEERRYPDFAKKIVAAEQKMHLE